MIKDNSESLLSALQREGYGLPAYCGGRGDCGKCKVRLLANLPEPKEQEIRLLPKKEREEGWRLACLVREAGEYELELPDIREIELESEEIHVAEAADESSCALAVDIGTTTLAMSLMDRIKKQVIRTVAGINHQRRFGADVLSRIDAANRGQGKMLQRLIEDDLNTLCRNMGAGECIEELSMPVIISGNTTMEHLLQGLSCQGLGVYPYKAEDLTMHAYKNMTILPGISTYVGADIVSGIVACGIDQKEELSILVDLGTNGEMVIGNRDRIMVASTAAGPAFEGGNISCGSPGIPGAIDTVEIKNGTAQITTIGGECPAGICGSGVLEIVYEFLKGGLMDETGLLNENYFDKGYCLAEGITFSEKDIREVQMAKSAIRAGIDILLTAFGVTPDQVDRLYLAGGFGQKLNCVKAVGIGLFPEELSDRILAVGNSSLKGAALLAMDPAFSERFQRVADISEEIHLANHEMFQDLYMKHMFFPGE